MLTILCIKDEPVYCKNETFYCKNGGTCFNLTGLSTNDYLGFGCNCQTGFSGDLCEFSMSLTKIEIELFIS